MSGKTGEASPLQNQSDIPGNACGLITVNWNGTLRHDAVHGSKYSGNSTCGSSIGVFGNIGRVPIPCKKKNYNISD